MDTYPNNPYTQDYREYIVDPGEAKREVSKPRRVVSIVLCAISNLILLGFCVIWAVCFYTVVIDDAANMGYWGGALLTLMLFLYLMPGFLITSIVAKILNRKSKWALINLIAIGIITVGFFLISLIVPALIL